MFSRQRRILKFFRKPIRKDDKLLFMDFQFAYTLISQIFLDICERTMTGLQFSL